MALALSIFKAENVGFVQLQRLFPEIMTQLLKKKSIILILSSFVWELFSLYRAIYTWKGCLALHSPNHAGFLHNVCFIEHF